MELCVVVAVYNGVDTLRAQLESLRGEVWEAKWEIVVADNGSSDGSIELAKEFARDARFRFIDASGARGQAHARNVGARGSDADKLLFVDQDDEVTPGYVEAMSIALDEHEFVTARIDERVLNPRWTWGSRPPGQDQWGLLVHAYGYLPAGSGSALGVRRAAFERIGGFDDSMPGGCEDIDFCWRMHRAGFTLELAPQAVLRYRRRARLREIFAQSRGYGRSGPILYAKYRESGMPRRGPRSAMRHWGGVLKSALNVRSKADLAAFVDIVGRRVGQIEGCVAARVLYV